MIGREDRKLARELIADAASACGMRRLEFMRAVNSGDEDANDELRLSVSTRCALDTHKPGTIDVERLREILQMVMEVITRLLEIFSMFA